MALSQDPFTTAVLEVSRLTPSLIRIVFGGPAVAGYAGLDVGDECLTMEFPDPAGTGEGQWRNYTVRRHAPGELTVDFVVHRGGAASSWAQHARVGDEVRMVRPRSWYAPPAGTTTRLLAADLAGLPALARLLEGMTPGELLGTTVVVEVLDRLDAEALPDVPGVHLELVVGSGNGRRPSTLAQRLERFVPDVRGGYVWLSAEAGECRTVRKSLRGVHGYPTDQAHTIGYWRFDSEAWAARFEPVAEEMLGHYHRALEEGFGETVASERYDAALEAAGL